MKPPDDHVVAVSTGLGDAKLGLPGPLWYPVEIGHYPAGEPYVKDYPNFCTGGFDILVRTADIGVLSEALMFVDAMRWRYGDETLIDLHLPHFPGARQDRLNPEGDALFTAKSVAEMINRRNFDEVLIIDPHSDVVPALVDNARVVTALDCIKEVLGHPRYDTPDHSPYHGVIAPDAGAEKRALAVAQWLNVPLFQAWKNRDVATGQITGFGCEELPEGRHYLMVDDLCDGGGTFLGLAAAIEQDVKIDLYVSHGVFSKGLEALTDTFNLVMATDSLGVMESPVREVSVATNMRGVRR